MVPGGRVDWIVLGNPDNRRVSGFSAAARGQGDTVRAVVPWSAFLDDPDALRQVSEGPALLRLESAGEEPGVQRQLLRLGGAGEVEPAHGQLVDPAAEHRGLLWALDRVSEVLAERPQWVPVATPERIATVFDKAAFHDVGGQLGVRRPEALAVASVDDLLEQTQALGRPVFVKLRHGSSASGLGVLLAGRRSRLMTTIRVTDEGWFNSLRVCRVTEPGRLREILAWQLDQGAVVEVAVPKPRLDGAFFDCRVLMVGYEPAFVVVRQSPHVITNLHLGGRRGSVDALRAAVRDEVWEAAMADCLRVARWYGGLHLGLDLLFERDLGAHRVLEANAFGDLLPRLSKDALSVYAYEVVASRNWRTSLQ